MPKSQRQSLEHQAIDDDARIQNVIRAIQHDAGPVADLARWALRNLEHHRFALVSVREAIEGGQVEEVGEIVREGLALEE